MRSCPHPSRSAKNEEIKKKKAELAAKRVGAAHASTEQVLELTCAAVVILLPFAQDEEKSATQKAEEAKRKQMEEASV